MSSKTVFKNIFFNTNTAITTFYAPIKNVQIVIKKLQINLPSLIELLQKQLDSIVYGDLNFQDRLNYQFIQYIIKELKLWAEFNNNQNSDWYYKKYYIFSWIIFSLNSQLLKIDEALKNKKTPFITNFITELKELVDFFVLLDPIVPLLDMISLKISLKMLEYVTNYMNMLEQYSTKNFFTDDKKSLQDVLANVLSVINEKSKLFLKQISTNNRLLSGAGKTFSTNYLKLHDIEIDSRNLDAFYVSSENIFQRSIIKLYNSMNLQKPMDETLKSILEPKISSIDYITTNINLIIQKIHQWLSTHNFFSFPISFSLKILVVPEELNEWFPEIYLIASDMSDGRKEIEIWINYSIGNSRQERDTLLNEKKIEYWLLLHVLPGDAFYSIASTRMSSLLRSQLNESVGKKRWQKYMFLLILERKYFIDNSTLLSMLWLLFIEFKKAVSGLRFHWDTENQSMEILSRELGNILNINTETAYKDLFLETLYPEESFVTWIEALMLKKLADTVVPISSLQRFNDFLIRLGNIPIHLIYQAAEQFFHIQITFPTLEVLTTVIEDLLSHSSE